MALVEIRDGRVAVRDVSAAQQRISVAERIRRIWAYFVVGLGLAGTVAWTALLGWMLYQAVLLLA
jgi:DNA integrity scanning protein DisA with diadenylate cyclase activity